MSDIKPVSQNTRISVDSQGLFKIKGHTVDIMGLIFQVQNDTKEFAQARLVRVAQDLLKTNEDSKKLISLLNAIRSIRPTGAADATVKGDKMLGIYNDYAKKHRGANPFGEFDLRSLAKVKYNARFIFDGGGKSISEEEARKESDYEVYASLTPNSNRGWGIDGKTAAVNLGFNDLKQAEVDQLIEGIKAKISAVSSKQELLNNDVQRYTRLSDETKEAISNIEKSLANAFVAEEGKI